MANPILTDADLIPETVELTLTQQIAALSAESSAADDVLTAALAVETARIDALVAQDIVLGAADDVLTADLATESGRIDDLETADTAAAAALAVERARIDKLETEGIPITAYGAVPTDIDTTTGTDCTDAFLDWIEDQYNSGSPVYQPLYFPPGRYHFSTPDILGELADRNPGLSAQEVWEMTRMLRIYGAFPQGESHGYEAHTVVHSTELYFHFTQNSDVWIEKLRYNSSVHFGNWSIENLTFKHADDSFGTFLRLGDNTITTNIGTSEAHGVFISGCYFSAPHFDETFVTDEGADGVCWQQDYDYPLVEFSAIYGLVLRDVGFRGGPAEGCIFRECDAPTIEGHCRAVLCNVGFAFIGNSPPGNLHNIYAEDCSFLGIYLETGRLDSPRVEFGYDDDDDAYLQKIPRDIPSGISWSITAGGSTISFSNVPSGKSIGYWLRKYQTFKLNPDQSGQPDREFIVKSISGDVVTFANADANCYVPVNISGTAGTSVTRYMANSLTVVGNRASVTSASLERNNAGASMPSWVLAPVKEPLHFNMMQGGGASPSSYYGTVIMHGHGVANALMGRVICSPQERRNHPAIVSPDDYPEYNGSVFYPVYHPERKYAYFLKPGYGINQASNQSRELLFVRGSATDTQLGVAPWVWRLDDLVTFANLRLYLPSGYGSWNFDVRAYHASGGSNLTLYDGVTANNLGAMTAGWGTYSGTTNAAATLLQINDISGLEVAWVGLYK